MKSVPETSAKRVGRPIHELRTDKARDQFARQRRLDLRRETLHCCTARAGTALAATGVADIVDVTSFPAKVGSRL